MPQLHLGRDNGERQSGREAKNEEASSASPLTTVWRLGLWVLAAVIFIFFVVTVGREAFLTKRKGDLDVYLRAAWAARSGENIYRARDNHRWRYTYPPLLASVLTPLADPPVDVPASKTAWVLPYWVSATIWFWLCIGCAFGAVHQVATALESAGSPSRSPPPRFSRAWWALRLFPFLVVALFLGDGLSRGQVTPVLLLLLAGCGAAILRGEAVQAGLWLGFAIMLKVFPAYLLVYPAARRNSRFFIGAAAGVLIAALIPFLTIGPTAAVASYQDYVSEMLIGEGKHLGDASYSDELYGTNSRIQGFEYLIYQTLHTDRASRERQPPMAFLLAHVVVSGLVTAAALWLMRRRADRVGEFLAFSALCVLMVPILPVSRVHYYALGALAFAGLFAVEWRRRGRLRIGWPLALTCVVFVLSGLLDDFENRFALEWGLATYAGLLVSFLALSEASHRSGISDASEQTDAVPSR